MPVSSSTTRMHRGRCVAPGAGGAGAVAALALRVLRSLFIGMKKIVRTRLKNHKAIVSSKFNQVRIDGQPHNPSGFAFAPSVIDARDEFTKRQASLPAIGSHGLMCNPGNRASAMGCSPHMGFLRIQP